MNPPEASIQSFIVKIWLDEESAESGTMLWHGSITHVGDHKRRYIKHLDEIPAFIASYLEEIQIRIDGRRSMQ